uniref:t-SNARE coiled-coil homology domain-containing protein n=1 Tax=Polytomella parva TaxID=51329 RepID=A0A7S0UQ48_9CHLO|mmetsp:Transcript_10579/g.19357  ORF Transcript_10579/g.19357 Transcript_10579/m.19357 type:complete len:120 (+) Transcript_10579:196-555(+)
MSGPRGGLSSRYAQHDVKINILDFDDEIDDLRGKVSRMKNLSLAIDKERRETGEIMNSLEHTLENATGSLRVATARLSRAYRRATSSYPILVLITFIVFLILFIYIASRLRRLKKAIIG